MRLDLGALASPRLDSGAGPRSLGAAVRREYFLGPLKSPNSVPSLLLSKVGLRIKAPEGVDLELSLLQ